MPPYIKHLSGGIGERIPLPYGFLPDEVDIENKLSSAERENSALKSKYQETLRQLEKQASELADIKSDRSKLVDEHKATLYQLEKVEKEKSRYCTKYKEVSERYKSLSTDYKELNGKHGDLSEKSKSQTREIRRLKETMEKMDAELATQRGQIDRFAADIARQNQRVNTSAIRDDDHFGREFANLAKDIRNWSFTHFFKRANSTLPEMSEDLSKAIREIAKGASLLDIFKNGTTNRRVVAGLLANELKKYLFDPPLLGLLPPPFFVFEKTIEKTGVQKSPWLSQTISVMVKDEQFEREFGKLVCDLSKHLSEMLGGLAAQESNESTASKRDQKLRNIVERAAKLARDLSQQPYWFYFLRVPTGASFNPNYMEDVGTQASMEEDDLDACHSDCKVSLSVFPLVYRLEHAEGGGIPGNSIINPAWVTVETEESETVVEHGGGDMTSEEAKVEEAKVEGPKSRGPKSRRPKSRGQSRRGQSRGG